MYPLTTLLTVRTLIKESQRAHEWSKDARRTSAKRNPGSTCFCLRSSSGCEVTSLHTRTGSGNLHIRLNQPTILIVGFLTCLGAILLVFSPTFFAANIISATVILYLAAVQSKAHNFRGALVELPFLFLSLLMLYLGYPFKHQP